MCIRDRYQCVFGRYPFDGSNPFEIMKEIVRGVEPWKHFPLYHDERVTVVQKTTSTKAPSHEPLLFTQDQYAAVCDLIEGLLQLDPVRRIGVPGSANLRNGSSSSSSIPPSLNRAVPEYSQLRSHVFFEGFDWSGLRGRVEEAVRRSTTTPSPSSSSLKDMYTIPPVSYTHLRAHETPEHLVCRLLLEKKKKNRILYLSTIIL
eukprot:TRINITY_DN31560_c0_g1_i1.p1 TRINITY_DN31560_c0_g1~~TRINITY_DN31560_c0_g1_i1.p1  ORF type:complete len:203 (-),score=38.98 TRINITY_DN31560_c0_g1_i1:45-653(-)